MNRKLYFAKRRKTPAIRLTVKRRLVDLLGGKCVDCGYSAHLAALDFDHIDPKTKKFGLSDRMAVSDYLELVEEARKCVLRCANCHRIRTYPDATDNNLERMISKIYGKES